jgi:O-antigen ligase
MKLKAYYIVLFFYSLIYSDLTQSILLTFGPLNIYYRDILFLALVLICFAYIKSHGLTLFTKSSSYLILFLLWLIFEVLRGYTKYGFSAVGESRSIAALFMCFVPFYLFNIKGKINVDDVYIVIEKTIYIGGIAALLIFIIEYSIGGRFYLNQFNQETLSSLEDARGIRYLDVYHIYNLLLLAVYLILRMDYRKKINYWEALFVLILICAALISQGRTPLISVAFGFIILLIIQGRYRLLLYSFLAAFILSVVYFLLYPEVFESYSSILLDSFKLFQPYKDITGTGLWRWAINIAAYEQGLETFWLGQSYGGYYYFDIPMFTSEQVMTEPHNMYIVVFLKAGFIGLLIFFVFLVCYSIELLKAYKKVDMDPKLRLYIGIVLLVVISQFPYGLGYTFISILGLFCGFGFLLLYLHRDKMENLRLNTL